MDDRIKKRVEKIAYLNWISRGKPKGDQITDWDAACEYVVNGNPKLLTEATRAGLKQAGDPGIDMKHAEDSQASGARE